MAGTRADYSFASNKGGRRALGGEAVGGEWVIGPIIRARAVRTLVPIRRAQKCDTIDFRAECRGGIAPGHAILEVSNSLQRCVPASFEFARDETLGRIDEFVAPGGQGGVVARFLDLPAQCLPDLARSNERSIFCREGRNRAGWPSS
jgi:hypothetical protein